MDIQVILVDEHDTVIGHEEKLKAHQLWLLHRAFSIYLIDDIGNLLLQQRAMSKYHAPGLWANTCCSHPFPDESVAYAAQRRLQEELGFDNSLDYTTEFIYKAPVPPNLIEHEYLHVFLWRYEWKPIIPDPDEVMDVKWISFSDLDDLVNSDDIILAPWTKITWPKIREEVINYNQT